MTRGNVVRGEAGVALKPAVRLVMAICACAIMLSPVPPVADAQATRIPFATPGQAVPSGTLEAAIYRPSGDGRFPLAVVSHGTPRNADQRRKMHPDYSILRSWLVDQGYTVIAPMRRGYGSSDGEFSEGIASCNNADYVSPSLMAANDVEAAMRFMRDQSFVDATRIVLVGHSAGGLVSLAAASRGPQGVIAVVNFAGGRGSQRPDFVCSADKEVDAMATFGRTTRVPTLWIYAENDHFFGPALARRMFAAFAAGSPQAEFIAAPPFGSDGHSLVVRGTSWQPAVGAFLKRVVPLR
jgi:dienelactone hydrolase